MASLLDRLGHNARDMFDWVPGIGLIDATVTDLSAMVFDRRLRVAVTGLRRSGKTVFLSALAHHLRAGTGLPFLSVVRDSRYLGARLLRVARDERAFPYLENLDRLSRDPPSWPDATDQISHLRLELRYEPRSLLGRSLGTIRSLFVEIVDYPGEWLMDLPLLETPYRHWSDATLAALVAEPRKAFAGPFLQALDAAEDLSAIDRLVDQYTHLLIRLRDEAGLSLLQPGRLIAPGEASLPRNVAFVPCPAHKPDLHRQMEQRYQAYLRQLVRPFKEEVVDTIDRQIVLLDVLESLNRGPDHFADTQKAIETVLESFSYGRSGYLTRLLSPKIDRLVFAATKADHVAFTQHANLERLLDDMVDHAKRAVRLEGVNCETLALASLRSTDTVKTDYDGQQLSCVRGVLVDDGKETILFPGEIPPTMPRGREWNESYFAFRRFAPRPLDQGGANSHIRLDRALELLIGDRLA